jgi:hypothetical protein
MSGWGNQQLTGLVQVASGSIGSGNNLDLITGGTSRLQLLSASISSGAVTPVGGIPSGWLLEDTIADTNGVQYLACEIGLPGGGTMAWAFNSVEQDLAGIVVPIGVSLQLRNGGAGGSLSLRRCSGTVTYIIID